MTGDGAESGSVIQMERLRAHQRRVLDTLSEGVIVYAVGSDGETRLELANAAACDVLGLDAATLAAMSSGQAAGPWVCDTDGKRLARDDLPFAVVARTGRPVRHFVWGCAHGDTPLRWLTSNAGPVFGASGVIESVVFSLVDITDRRRARYSLETAQGTFSSLVEHSSDVICIMEVDGVVRYASPAYATVYGESPAVRVGRPIFDRIHGDDRARVDGVLAELVAAPDKVITLDCRVVHPDGTVRHLEVTATNRLADPAVGGIVTNSRDVTERVETAERLAHEAMHDALTGLANRALLLDRISQALRRGERGGDRCALLFIDLDHFKRVNDSLGHAAGDHLLMSVADRLLGVMRPADTVARLGGDEFVVLAEHVADAGIASQIAERVRRALNEPIDLGGRVISVECSIGITLADGSPPDALLQQADTALYRAKAGGRGRWELYDQAMRRRAQKRIDTEEWLRRSLGTDRIVVHYQAIVALPTGERVGSEALVRMVDHHRRLVPPDEFIPVAEDTGLIVPLGLEVLRRACAQQRRWTDEGRSPSSISVNLSARQLRTPSLVHDVSEVLAATGVLPAALCLELTESALIDADAATCRALHDLTEMGVAVALDDFGTGMSSLAHLRRFPISGLKIDRSFVAGLGVDRDDTEVVRSIISLGRALGLGIVAEGVETLTQGRMLAGFGCPQAQGYLYGRATAAGEWEREVRLSVR